MYLSMLLLTPKLFKVCLEINSLFAIAIAIAIAFMCIGVLMCLVLKSPMFLVSVLLCFYSLIVCQNKTTLHCAPMPNNAMVVEYVKMF